MMIRRSFYINLFLIVFMLSSCLTKESKISNTTKEEEQILIRNGQPIAKSLISTLKGELQVAMKAGGVIEAIKICKKRATTLTDSISNSNINIEFIKRTTFKYRNPNNAPNKYEAGALQYFETYFKENKSYPDQYSQKIIDGNQTTYYYYQPLKIAGLCLVCHGDENTMSNEVRDMLSTKYPNDKAVGYNEGDFRGLISVKFSKLPNDL